MLKCVLCSSAWTTEMVIYMCEDCFRQDSYSSFNAKNSEDCFAMLAAAVLFTKNSGNCLCFDSYGCSGYEK